MSFLLPGERCSSDTQPKGNFIWGFLFGFAAGALVAALLSDLALRL